MSNLWAYPIKKIGITLQRLLFSWKNRDTEGLNGFLDPYRLIFLDSYQVRFETISFITGPPLVLRCMLPMREKQRSCYDRFQQSY